MDVHARTLRERFGDALEKVIMGLYSGGVQIIAGTDAGIDNCPHDAYVSGSEGLAMVGLPAGPPPRGPLRSGPLRSEPPSGGPPPSETPSSGPPPGAEPAVAGPAAAASELAAPAGPSPR